MTKLLISCSSSPGGLYLIDAYKHESSIVQPIESMGVLNHQEKIVRMRAGRQNAVMDIISADGNMDTHTIPNAGHPHSIVYHDGRFAIADTLNDRVIWVNTKTAAVEREWQATELGDAWHISGLVVDEGRLFASCFGRFTEDRGWYGNGSEMRGEIFEVDGEAVVTGLGAPHSPRRLDGNWLVSNSYEAALSIVDTKTSARIADLVLGGWPTGICLKDGIAWVAVGDSERKPGEAQPSDATPRRRPSTGKLVAVDVDRWVVVDEMPLPCSGVFDVMELPVWMM